MTTLQKALFALALIGTTLFGFLFSASIVNPGYVEDIAKDIIRRQVERKVQEKIDALDARYLSGKAADLLKKHHTELEAAKQQLKDRLPEKLATIIAQMRNLDCECRRKIEKQIRESTEWHLANVARAEAQMASFIQSKYMEVAEKLAREFRIFTGTNAAVFALFGLAVFLRRKAGLQLIPPALILLCAATATAYLYLFQQDWLHTILFSDYAGYSYVGYLSAVFAFLCDILFNKARITTRLLNVLFNILGSSVQALPC